MKNSRAMTNYIAAATAAGFLIETRPVAVAEYDTVNVNYDTKFIVVDFDENEGTWLVGEFYAGNGGGDYSGSPRFEGTYEDAIEYFLKADIQ